MNIFKHTGTPQKHEGNEEGRMKKEEGNRQENQDTKAVSSAATTPEPSTSHLKPPKGTFIVIEGTDGSGKGTQFHLLAEKLTKQGYDVASFDFPRYDEPSSYFVREYLNGNYGTAEQVGPYVGSLFYALDRYAAARHIREALEAGKIVLSNRYVGSNMGHQGTKLPHAEQRRGYFIWVDNLEFEMLRVPRPDLNLVLRVPAEIAQSLVDQKATRSYTDKKRDLHEADIDHLKRAVEVYDDLCQLFPKDFQQLDCVRDEQLLAIEEVEKLVWEKVLPYLPLKPKHHPAHDSVSKTNIASPASVHTPAETSKPTEATKATARPSSSEENPYVIKDGSIVRPSSEGLQFLEKAVTDATGNVYAFTDTLSPITIAAAMARLSRRGDDMRVTILDEFAYAMGKDEKLLQRVITAYGDDSVQQLVGQHFVIENASNLLTKKLEWGRLAAYLEQSTRYIYFDQKDQNGHYKYFVPDTLNEVTKAIYITEIDAIFDRYSQMVRELTDFIRAKDTTPEAERDAAWKGATRAQACDAIRPVLPVATTSTVGIFASGQALESLIMHLLSDELSEAKITGQRLLQEARKIIPTFLERADKPERGGALVAYRATTAAAVKEMAQKYLPKQYDNETPAVTLTEVWPRNELSLVADMLYEHSNLSLTRLRHEVDTWSYDKKLEVFKAYMGERLNRRHRPGRALEKAHYGWDLLCDYGIFRDLQRHRMVDDLEWQELTPRYGFDIPQLVEEAGLTDIFEECFDISLKLHSLLQQKGYAVEAQYATLLGHKMRWKVTYNAREAFHLHELRTSPQGHPGYRKLVNDMHEKLREVHPLLADAMKFVNSDEDPALTRLAAERYTQFKLQQVDKT